MKSLFLIINALVFVLKISCQVTWEKEYILKNKIRTIITRTIAKSPEHYSSWIESIEEFDIAGNLTHKNVRGYDNFCFFYDSLDNLKAEKINSLTHTYKNIYQNGDLVQWIHPLKCDTFFYSYNQQHQLIKEELHAKGALFDRLFGYDPFIFPGETTSYILYYEYGKNFTSVKKASRINGKDTIRDESFFEYKKGHLKRKVLDVSSNYRYTYIYKKGRLIESNCLHTRYVFKHKKGLTNKMVRIEKNTEEQGSYFQEFTYTFWQADPLKARH